MSERASGRVPTAAPAAVPHVDVIDSSWIGVPPATVAPLVADATRWGAWWPGVDLRASEYRGAKGVRWFVRSAEGGRLAGSMEIWLEPVADGTVAHYFLRLDATGEPLSPREREQLVHRYRIGAKQLMWSLSDIVDPGRLTRVRAPRRHPHG